MSKKKIKGDCIYFTGESSNDVTGSQYFIRFGECQCLLECGLHQSKSNDYLDSYKINSAKFKFNPAEIDFLFVCHPHIDHCGLIPRLVKEGFKGKIITTKKTAMIMKSLLLNSCYIVQEEARILTKRYKRSYKPLYEEHDVYNSLKLLETYDDFNSIIELNDNVKFQWLKNSHCLGATQLQLILHNKTKKRKILYTSDIGALNPKNHYVDYTEIPTMFNDVTIMESTYGSKSRQNKKKRSYDKEHLKAAIYTVIERKGSIVFPCFSFARTQELLTVLYEILSCDVDFDTDVIVDSKLSCEICNLYNKLLDEDDLDLWNNVVNWKNLKFVSEKEESQIVLSNNKPKIVLSSSGFCTNGRIVKYLQKYLKDFNSMIIFSGYIGDNPSYLSYRIKNCKPNKTISINKTPVLNRADCITLSTFSSHAGYDDLITYGSSLNTEKVVLVHGTNESKKCLAENLRSSISENNKTYKVVISTKDMIINI